MCNVCVSVCVRHTVCSFGSVCLSVYEVVALIDHSGLGGERGREGETDRGVEGGVEGGRDRQMDGWWREGEREEGGGRLKECEASRTCHHSL